LQGHLIKPNEAVFIHLYSTVYATAMHDVGEQQGGRRIVWDDL